MGELSYHPSHIAAPQLPCAKVVLSFSFFFFLHTQYQQQAAAARGRIRGSGVCYETFWRIGEQLFPLYTFCFLILKQS